MNEIQKAADVSSVVACYTRPLVQDQFQRGLFDSCITSIQPDDDFV
jgi:hypothetical protein